MADKKTLPNILDYFDKDNNLDKSSFINAFSDIQGYADLKNYDLTGLVDFVNYDGNDITSAFSDWSRDSNFGNTASLGVYLSRYFIDAYETPMSYLKYYNEVLSNNPNDPYLEFLKLEVDKSNDYLNYFFSSANPLDSMRSNDNSDFSFSNLDIAPFMFCASILIVALFSVWIIKKTIRLYK
nr:hypothetical protein [uncultured Campylobacter sp.]